MASNLPQMQNLSQLSTKWASILNPIVANPILQGQLLQNVKLVNGATSVNHGLSRKLQGWFICGIDGIASIYDTQASNQHQDLTLNLVSNAAVNVTLWVF